MENITRLTLSVQQQTELAQLIRRHNSPMNQRQIAMNIGRALYHELDGFDAENWLRQFDNPRIPSESFYIKCKNRVRGCEDRDKTLSPNSF